MPSSRWLCTINDVVPVSFLSDHDRTMPSGFIECREMDDTELITRGWTAIRAFEWIERNLILRP